MRISYFILICLVLASSFTFNTASGATIRVEAWIDGTSQLQFSQSTAFWHHLRYAAPGRLSFQNLPTIINGVEWYPIWPDLPDAENRDCNCYSDVFRNVAPPLSMRSADLPVRIIQSRGATTIVQQPRADNDFTLIVEFNDDVPVGASWYIIEIETDESPLSVEPSTWGAIKALFP